MKIPTEDFTVLQLNSGDTYADDVRGGDGGDVMDIEDDKVAVMVLRIPNEDFSDGTVVIDGIISK